MTHENPLRDLLGISLPIIQAPMAGVSTPAMAAAVSAAGGLGSIGVGPTSVAGVRDMVMQVRARHDGPLNVNLFCHAPAVANSAVEAAWIEKLRPDFAALGAAPPPALRDTYRSFIAYDEMLALLLELRPSAVSFHFGLPPAAALQALHAAGSALLACVTSLEEARLAIAAGCDALVAQGWEAGGHRGIFNPDAPDDQLGTMALTRLLVRETERPVIAAGGIMDGAGIAAALKLGAVAAQLGTAFVAADESQADAGYRAALASTAAQHTTMTRVISGRPARCLPNRFTAFGAGVRAGEVPAYPMTYDLGKALHAAGKARGEFGYGAQWAGQGAPLCRPMPAAQLVATLAAELERAL